MVVAVLLLGVIVSVSVILVSLTYPFLLLLYASIKLLCVLLTDALLSYDLM